VGYARTTAAGPARPAHSISLVDAASDTPTKRGSDQCPFAAFDFRDGRLAFAQNRKHIGHGDDRSITMGQRG